MEQKRNPLRIILSSTIFAFFILLLFYVILKLLLVYDYDRENQTILSEVAATVENISEVGWDFVKPFLQLVIILLIVEWALNKIGISLSGNARIEWNVQTVMALLIVGAFALAALSGIKGAESLESIALVVVGFYFGTQQRKITEDPPTGSTRP